MCEFLGILIIGTLVFGIGSAVYQVIERSRSEARLDAAMSHVRRTGFQSEFSLRGVGGGAGIAIDKDMAQIALIRGGHHRVVPASALASVEIVEDGATVTTTSRGSQFAGAVAGGLLAGGAGAIIGGLSGKQQTTGTASSIAVRVVVDVPEDPSWVIECLSRVTERGSPAHQKALETARTWHARLSVAMRRARQPSSQFDAPDSPFGLPGELERLARLHASGSISDEEFRIAKHRLLGGG